MSEGQRLEWKTAWRDDHLKSVCAFANADGGTLEIGRDDEGTVVGVGARERRRLLEELPNKLRDLLGVVAAMAGFRKRARKEGRLSGNALDDDDAGLIEKLRLTDGDYLTKASVLLFHRDPERFVAGAHVKVGYFRNEWDVRHRLRRDPQGGKLSDARVGASGGAA